MFQRLRELLTGSGKQLLAPPPSGTIIREVAVDQLFSILGRMPDPDLVLKKLGMSRADLRKLETDDEITGALETRRDAVVAVPWHLDPYDNDNAVWLADQLDAHVESVVTGAWQAVPYGYAVQEVVYKPGPRIGIDRVVSKPLEWFEPRKDGLLWMTLPGAAATPVDTQYKFLLTRRRPTYRNPYGDALLTRCYWPWFFRENGWRFWMRFLERFGDPLLLGQVEDPGAFVSAMQSLGMDAVIGVGMAENVNAVTASGKGEFTLVEDALTRRIQRLILGQTASSGDAGGFSQGQMQENVRMDKRNSDVRLVTRTVQTLVNALWQLNRFGGTPPQFIMEDGTGLEKDRAERDVLLVNAGVLRLTEQYLLGNYDFEEGDFEMVEQRKPAEEQEEERSEQQQGAGAARTLAQGRTKRTYTPDQQEVEELVENARSRAASPFSSATLLAIIAASATPEELVEKLTQLYQDTEQTAFRELVEDALLVADVVGYANSATHLGE